MKAGAKGTVKSTEKAVKTAEKTSKAAIKTAEATAKATQKAAEATAKAAQKAAEIARQTAILAYKAAVAAAKVIAAAIKAIIAAIEKLIAAIAAGGWVAVVVVVVICLVALIVGSCFGIFFSSEDKNDGSQTMREVVVEINQDYQNQLDTIKVNNPYDDLEMSGSRAVWPEVLSVYAVKTTTDPDNPQEVASLTDEKKQLLTDIFWEMNDISYRTETDTETEIIESDDGNGNILEETVEVTKTTLYITVSHKTAEQMSDQYRFKRPLGQRQQLYLIALQVLLHFREFLHQVGTAAAGAVDAHQIHLVIGEIRHIRSLSALFVCAVFSLLDGAGAWSMARTEGFLPDSETCLSS